MTKPARTTGRRRARWRLGAAIIAALSVALVGAIASPAYAKKSYPSWQDVQDAKANQAAAAKQVDRIESLINQLQSEVDQANALAKKRGDEAFDARRKYDSAVRRATDLQAQAAASQKTADAATTEAGRLAAQLYQAGGTDLTLNLFLTGSKNGHKADQLLSRLGSMSKLVERSSEIYAGALAKQNIAKSLSAQAEVAKTEREKLKKAADAALQAANEAAKTAQAKYAEQQSHLIELQAQLAALKDKTAATTKGYQEGVEERRREAAAAAAAAAAAGSNLPGGYIGPQGWAVPVKGWIADGFGARTAPCAGCTTFHEGVDLAAACHTPIHAAHDGVVIYAGWWGGYGNFVIIDHGNGIETAYGHIWTGETYVGYGQRVVAGEAIARVGTTGHSTGCHLHFEVRRNGVAINPITYMKNHGAPVG